MYSGGSGNHLVAGSSTNLEQCIVDDRGWFYCVFLVHQLQQAAYCYPSWRLALPIPSQQNPECDLVRLTQRRYPRSCSGNVSSGLITSTFSPAGQDPECYVVWLAQCNHPPSCSGNVFVRATNTTFSLGQLTFEATSSGEGPPRPTPCSDSDTAPVINTRLGRPFNSMWHALPIEYQL
jgi:hypothetical protein